MSGDGKPTVGQFFSELLALVCCACASMAPNAKVSPSS